VDGFPDFELCADASDDILGGVFHQFALARGVSSGSSYLRELAKIFKPTGMEEHHG
jgi:hypothetical protein